MRWGDVNVLSPADQRDLLLDQRLWRLRIQILAFTGVLLVVMTIVVSVIVYTMTIEKLHEFAMLKLLGARNRFIMAIVAQQAMAIALGGFAVGTALAHVVFPHFPRRVLIEIDDLGALLLVLVLIAGLASLVGISRVMKVRAQEVLA